jgi:large subunit ribosomal protein L4
MSSVSLRSTAGAEVGSVDLADDVFGIQPNVPVMHQVVTAQLAHRRAGSHSTKTRSEVRGGGRKPYRQKGTGNARQGSTRSPQWVGGGVALGPKPRSYAQRTPKKMIRLALRSALSDRAAQGKVVVIDDWAFDVPRTRDAKAALSALGIEGGVLVVVGRDDETVVKSFRNLPEAQLIDVAELNAYDVLCNEWIVFTRATLPAGHASEDTGEPAGDTDAEPAEETYGPGSAAPLADGSAPEGFPIKGNADSMLYHEPGTHFYGQTKAEVYFATAEDAERAGFTLPPSQQAAEEDK